MKKTKPRGKRNAIPKKRRCKGTLPDGSRCRKVALDGEDYCHLHSQNPARASARREAARKGGSVPRRPILPAREALTVEKSRQLLSAASEMLLEGKLSCSAARALSNLLATDQKLSEYGELMERIEKLEAEEE